MEMDTIELVQYTVKTAIVMGGPFLLISAVAGIVLAVFQTITQVQDQTVSFVFKLLAVAVAFAMLLPWLVGRMLEFSTEVWSIESMF